MAATGMNWGYKFNRLNPEGLDPSEYQATKAAAEKYLQGGIAYDGQILYVKDEDAYYQVSITDGERNLKPLISGGQAQITEIDGGEF